MDHKEFLVHRRAVMTTLKAASDCWDAGQESAARSLVMTALRQWLHLEAAWLTGSETRVRNKSAYVKYLVRNGMLDAKSGGALRSLDNKQCFGIAVDYLANRVAAMSDAFGFGPGPKVAWSPPNDAEELVITDESGKESRAAAPKVTSTSARKKPKPCSQLDILKLSVALVLACIGLHRFGALYARIVFERLLGHPANFTDAIKSATANHPPAVGKRYRVVYGRLSQAVHGRDIAEEDVASAVIGTYRFGTEVAR